MRSLIVEAFARASVELHLDLPNLSSGDLREVGTLREILADEAVGVFVEAGFPRMIGMGEVGVGSEDLGEQLVKRELRAVVVGFDEHLLADGTPA